MPKLIDGDALVYALTEMVRHSTGEYKHGIDAARLVAMEAPAIGGWTRVKDGLPEKDGLYLVYGMSEAMRKLLPDCVPIWLCYWRRKYGGWYDIEMCQGYDFITHWMPLPEPLKEEPQCPQPTP